MTTPGAINLVGHDSDPKPFLPALTGVRAFAALWVLAMHMGPVVTSMVAGPVASAWAFVATPGFLGVDLFFVLSGFIISYNYAAIFDAGFSVTQRGRFLWARLARIYPVHFVLLIALAAAVLGLGFGRVPEIASRRWSITGLVESLLLIQAWMGNIDVWNSVAWSISSEWLAYLCFPLVSAVALHATRRTGPAAWTIVGGLAALPAVAVTLNLFGSSISALKLLQIVSEFLAGCITYRIFAAAGAKPPSVLNPGAILFLLVCSAGVFARAGLSAYWTVVLVAPMLLGLANDSGRPGRLFAHPWMVYWGKVSFALYMTHYSWLWLLHSVLPLRDLAGLDIPSRIGIVLVHLLPPFAIASATYHLIEQPARRWLSNFVASPSASLPTAARFARQYRRPSAQLDDRSVA
jgi:peptidoglycan/LPS O-acetylase OafA/YrhL